MRRCAPQPEAPVHRMIEDRDPCTGPLMHPSLEAPVVEQSHAKHAAHPVKNAAGQNIAAVAAAFDAAEIGRRRRSQPSRITVGLNHPSNPGLLKRTTKNRPFPSKTRHRPARTT